MDKHAAPLERALAGYDAEIALTDREIGWLVARLDGMVPSKDLLLVIAGDHGEGILHGFAGHGPTLYEGTVHVPLIFRWNGVIPAGGRSDDLVSLIDVVPTLLGFLKIASERNAFKGQDRFKEMLGGSGTIQPGPVSLQRRHYESKQASTYEDDPFPEASDDARFTISPGVERATCAAANLMYGLLLGGFVVGPGKVPRAHHNEQVRHRE